MNQSFPPNGIELPKQNITESIRSFIHHNVCIAKLAYTQQITPHHKSQQHSIDENSLDLWLPPTISETKKLHKNKYGVATLPAKGLQAHQHPCKRVAGCNQLLQLPFQKSFPCGNKRRNIHRFGASCALRQMICESPTNPDVRFNSFEKYSSPFHSIGCRSAYHAMSIRSR